MTQHWILTVKDEKIGTKKLDALSIYRQRMKDKFWGIGEPAKNRRWLKTGDHVIFYLGGKNGGKFIGASILDSPYIELSKKEKEKLTHPPFFTATHGVKLGEIEEWDEPLSIYPLISKLNFIANKTNWGSHLQGSIKEIRSNDYTTIILEHESIDILKISSQKEPKLTAPTPRISTTRQVRDYFFQRRVRENYEDACAVCGKTRYTKLGHPEVESAHIYPKAKNGDDDLRNGIALCKLHHWAFENGLFSIKDDYSIIIEGRIKHAADYKEVYRYEGKRITLPKDAQFNPHTIYLSAHRNLHGFQ